MSNWWEIYYSSPELTREDRILLSYFTENEWVEQFPKYFLINKRTKTTVKESVDIFRHYVNTGEWKYDCCITWV